jgi:hypothetical protein
MGCDAEYAADVHDGPSLGCVCLGLVARLQRRRLLQKLSYLCALAQPKPSQINVHYTIVGLDIQLMGPETRATGHTSAVDAIMNCSKLPYSFFHHSTNIDFARHIAHDEKGFHLRNYLL